jgi:2-polyprenyl-3-methyl-5-hydroxy-6-metoxy-1,4-benzoquinol methylase
MADTDERLTIASDVDSDVPLVPAGHPMGALDIPIPEITTYEPMIRENMARPVLPHRRITDLQAEIDELGRLGVTSEYKEKQLHRVPDWPVVERVPLILEHCRGQRVLNVGCASGDLHRYIQAVAVSVVGIDHDACGHPGDIWVDLDDYLAVQSVFWPSCDVIVCGEVLEHLLNPGLILARLRGHAAKLLVSVPNAFAGSGQHWLQRGWINVNKDHTAWYCPQTLKTLLEKCGYTISQGYWYGGPPKWAEGMIVIAS